MTDNALSIALLTQAANYRCSATANLLSASFSPYFIGYNM